MVVGRGLRTREVSLGAVVMFHHSIGVPNQSTDGGQEGRRAGGEAGRRGGGQEGRGAGGERARGEKEGMEEEGRRGGD